MERIWPAGAPQPTTDTPREAPTMILPTVLYYVAPRDSHPADLLPGLETFSDREQAYTVAFDNGLEVWSVSVDIDLSTARVLPAPNG